MFPFFSAGDGGNRRMRRNNRNRILAQRMPEGQMEEARISILASSVRKFSAYHRYTTSMEGSQKCAPAGPGRDEMRAWRPAVRRLAGRKQAPENAGWSGTASEQIVQGLRLTPLVFRQGFSRHAADRVAFRGEALLPGVLVGERRQDLGCNRILLIVRQRDDFLQRFL